MNTSNSHIVQIYNSRKHLLEILETRGFDISQYNNFGISEIGILSENDQLDMLFENNKKKIYVKYFTSKQIKPQNIYNIFEDLFHLENILSKNDDLIIILKDQPNDTLIQTIKDIWIEENIYISLIYIKCLQFNILKHELVPKHSILNTKETEEFKIKYNISENSELPEISYFDPVCLVIGVRPDNIVKIDRKSRTTINSTYYRVCKL